jgi:hypothetical protein
MQLPALRRIRSEQRNGNSQTKLSARDPRQVQHTRDRAHFAAHARSCFRARRRGRRDGPPSASFRSPAHPRHGEAVGKQSADQVGGLVTLPTHADLEATVERQRKRTTDGAGEHAPRKTIGPKLGELRPNGAAGDDGGSAARDTRKSTASSAPRSVGASSRIRRPSRSVADQRRVSYLALMPTPTTPPWDQPSGRSRRA